MVLMNMTRLRMQRHRCNNRSGKRLELEGHRKEMKEQTDFR